MSRYSKEEKDLALEIIEGGISLGQASRQTGISEQVIRYLRDMKAKYGSEPMPTPRYDWSGDEKLAVLEYMQTHHLGYTETGIHFGIRGSSTVWNWAERYRREGMAGLEPKKRGRPKKWRPPDDTMTPLEKLEAENLYLRAENAYLKKLNALIAEMERQEQERKQQSSRN